MAEQQKKNPEDLVSTHLISFVFFTKEIENCKRMSVKLFERGMLFSVYKRTEEGPFVKKPEKSHFISNNDFEDLTMMVRQARKKMVDKVPFEFVMQGKETAFGILGMNVEDKYVTGTAIYSVVDGQVIQNSKIICPFMDTNRVKLFASDGGMEDMVRLGGPSETNTFVNMLEAILNGTSTVMSFHQEKLAKKNSANYGNKKVEIQEDYESNDSDEYPWEE